MAAGLDLKYYGLKKRSPSSSSLSSSSASNFLNKIFLSTANAAAKSLVSAASNQVQERPSYRKKLVDHLRLTFMLTTCLSVWLLKSIMDILPSSLTYVPRALIGRFSSVGSFFKLPSLPSIFPSSSSKPSQHLVPYSVPSLDLVPYEGYDVPSVRGLGRALSQILFLLNEMPATSSKYQFAMAMADNIMQDNARNLDLDLLVINRTALASGFARTSNLLYEALERRRGEREHADAGAWHTRLIAALPLGSYIIPYWNVLRICVNAILSTLPTADMSRSQNTKLLDFAGSGSTTPQVEDDDVVAEKLGQELLWMTRKLRDYGSVDEAMAQWSIASGLASLSLSANSRIQGYFVKISAILFCELSRGDIIDVLDEVKYRLLLLWLPLLCHGSNGLAYPILSGFEKVELERAINNVIGSLPAIDQEVILTNWLKDFAISASDWPNLQLAYDRWCRFARKQLEADNNYYGTGNYNE